MSVSRGGRCLAPPVPSSPAQSLLGWFFTDAPSPPPPPSLQGHPPAESEHLKAQVHWTHHGDSEAFRNLVGIYCLLSEHLSLKIWL